MEFYHCSPTETFVALISLSSAMMAALETEAG